MREISKIGVAVAGFLAVGMVSVCLAGPSVPKPTAVLFDAPHLDKVEAGATLSYRLEHNVSDEQLLGQAFSDDIKVAVDRVSDDGKRDVKVSVFSGDRARPNQNVPGLVGNPLLVIFLDRAVKNYSMIAGGKPAYLKNRFKIELQTSAKVEAKKVSYNGSEVDGYEVSVTPFIRDPARHKMRGYEGSHYKITLSDKVPGHFVEMVAVIESPKKGAPRLEERVTFSGVGGKN